MEIRARYILVGLFVSVFTLALLVGFLWLASGQGNKDNAYYDILFSEDVTGLQVGGVVRYRGVEVGRVDSVQLDLQQIDKVRVTIKILATTRLYEDATASLESQGITGIPYVLLQGGSADKKLLRVVSVKPYPQINPKPGKLQEVLQVLTDVSLVVDDLRVISKQFREVVPTIINQENAALLSNMVADLQTSVANLKEISKGLREATEGDYISNAIQSLQKTLQSFEQTSVNVNNLLTNITEPVQTFLSPTLRQINSLVTEAKDFMVLMKRFAEKLERDPSQLILGPR